MEPRREITHARVLRLSLPIVISNATVPILGAVDTGVVGQLGEAAPIGAVGIGAIVITGIYWIFGFLRMGTTGLAAQAFGAGRMGEVAALLTRVLVVGGLAGVILILGQLPIFELAFYVSPASAQVEGLARDYVGIRILSAPAAIAMFGITGWLIAQERTTAVLVLQLWMNGANILLDLWFVLGLGWGVEGVAIATVIAEWSGLGLWLCRSVFGGSGFVGGAWRDPARVFDGAALRNMVMVNTDILIRSLLLQAIFISFLFSAARFGDVALAATQVLMQFLSITAHALDGFAFAAEAFVGQAMGARAVAELRRGALYSSFWGAIVVTILAIVFAVFGGALIDLMTTAPQVRIEARAFLPWMVAAPVFGLAAYMFDGIFIGATRTADMRNMMVVSAGVYALAVLALVPMMGHHGLWAALIISFVARAGTLAMRYPALERAAQG